MSKESLKREAVELTGKTLRGGAFLAALGALGAAIGNAAEGAKFGALVDAATGGATLGTGAVIGGLTGLAAGFGLLSLRRRTLVHEGNPDNPVVTKNNTTVRHVTWPLPQKLPDMTPDMTDMGGYHRPR